MRVDSRNFEPYVQVHFCTFKLFFNTYAVEQALHHTTDVLWPVRLR